MRWSSDPPARGREIGQHRALQSHSLSPGLRPCQRRTSPHFVISLGGGGAGTGRWRGVGRGLERGFWGRVWGRVGEGLAFYTSKPQQKKQKKTTLTCPRLNPVSLQSNCLTLVATIHFSPFTDQWFTDFIFIHRLFPQQEGSFCPFTCSLGNHGRTLHSFTPFT